MTRLSSRTTFYTKRIFPILAFVLIAWFAGLVLADAFGETPWPAKIVVLCALTAFACGVFASMRCGPLKLVDEVWDEGNSLLIVNRHEKFRIGLADVIKVHSSRWSNPPWITLSLRTPLPWGTDVKFIAAESLLQQFRRMFHPPAVAGELIERVDAARRGAR